MGGNRDARARGLSDDQLAAVIWAKANLWKNLDIPELMQAAIEAAVASTGLDTGAIYLLNENVLYLGATTPALPPGFPEPLRFANAADHPHIMRAIDTEKPVSVADLREATLTVEERQVSEVRDLRSILYVPLFANDRPVGVFMVASAGEPRVIGDAEITVSQTLAYSIAMAIEDAHLFDSLMAQAAEGRDDIRGRLEAIAASAARATPSNVDDFATGVRDRINQRLQLLELRDHLLAGESGAGCSEPGAGADRFAQGVSLAQLAVSRDATRAADAELDLGLSAALEHLARTMDVGPDSSAITVDADAQMTDADTMMLIYSSAKEMLDEIARHPRLKTRSIRVRLDDTEHVLLDVYVEDGDPVTTAEYERAMRKDLEPLQDRLRRVGGDLLFQSIRPNGAIATVALPHFSAAF